MRIAIVDDEMLFAKNFSEVIRRVFTGSLQRLEIFLSAEGILSSPISFDLIFLDIEMPGLSGIELAQKHREALGDVVFVTNRDDLVFEAYNTTNSLGFIRKSSFEQDLKSIIKRINRNNQLHNGFSVKNGDIVTKIKYSDIFYIEKVGHNVVIHTPSGKYSQRTTISNMETSLLPFGFVRTHIGFIVNLAHVVHVKSNCAVLANEAVIPVSRSNVKSVKDKFLERNVLVNE